MPYMHTGNDIFLTGIIGYDRLKFSEIYASRNEIPGYATGQTVPH